MNEHQHQTLEKCKKSQKKLIETIVEEIIQMLIM